MCSKYSTDFNATLHLHAGDGTLIVPTQKSSAYITLWLLYDYWNPITELIYLIVKISSYSYLALVGDILLLQFPLLRVQW